MEKKTTKILKKEAPKGSQSLDSKLDCMVAMFEEQREDFKAFGQELAGFGTRLGRIETRVDATFEEAGRIRIELTVIKDDIVEIKSDVKIVKTHLAKKADANRVEILETQMRSY